MFFINSKYSFSHGNMNDGHIVFINHFNCMIQKLHIKPHLGAFKPKEYNILED